LVAFVVSVTHTRLYCTRILFVVGRDSSVAIATRYGLDGSGIESRWLRNFPHPFKPALGPTQPPIQWVPGLSRGVKRPGRGSDHPSQPSAEVKERVELYIYSVSGPYHCLLKLYIQERQSICICLFVCLFVFGATVPQWARASSFTRFLDHTQ
jgi:hypothetical protein